MNEDMPWVFGLTDEEVQELRSKKQELTEYGKQKIRELMKNKHPANDWEWSEDAENGFVEWFNSDCGPYTWKCEYFYGDCEVEDEKTRKDLMYKWAHAAYVSGYERGLYGRMEQLAEIERKDLIDYALEELNAIVMGGQDTREFYNSVSYIRNVLERLK